MNLKLIISMFSMLLLPSFTATSQSKTYTISLAESNIHVIVAKAGLFSRLGRNHDMGITSFSGQITILSGGASGGLVALEVDAKSLVVLDKGISEKVRKKIAGAMHNEVLKSATYEKITFKSVSVSNQKKTGENTYNFVLNGDLSLHGVTKPIAVPVNLIVSPQQVRATGQYTLKQTDFGIKPYSAALGTIKVKNEVIIHFDVVAKT